MTTAFVPDLFTNDLLLIINKDLGFVAGDFELLPRRPIQAGTRRLGYDARADVAERSEP